MNNLKKYRYILSNCKSIFNQIIKEKILVFKKLLKKKYI